MQQYTEKGGFVFDILTHLGSWEERERATLLLSSLHNCIYTLTEHSLFSTLRTWTGLKQINQKYIIADNNQKYIIDTIYYMADNNQKYICDTIHYIADNSHGYGDEHEVMFTQPLHAWTLDILLLQRFRNQRLHEP